jgi:hypothetical protein
LKADGDQWTLELKEAKLSDKKIDNCLEECLIRQIKEIETILNQIEVMITARSTQPMNSVQFAEPVKLTNPFVA